MKIYVSHGTNFNFRDELYKPLQESPLAKKHEFIFPHEKNGEQYPSKQLFADKACDLVLAEVSFPSTGQGIELGWAGLMEIKTVCFSKVGSKISDSLKIVSKDLSVYKDRADFIRKLT